MSEFGDIGESLRCNDSDALRRHISNLAGDFPDTWARDLLRVGGIPDPQTDACDDAIEMLEKAIGDLRDASGLSATAISQAETLLRLLRDYRQRYSNTTTRLASCAFLDDAPAIRIWRLASHVEDQHRLCMLKSQGTIGIEGLNTVHVAHSAHADDAGTLHNLQDAWEGIVECTELTMRYLLHRDGPARVEDVTAMRSAYEDPEFERILRLAARWRALQLTYDDLRYGGWKREVEELPDEQGALHKVETHSPSDVADLIRKHVSFVRHKLFTIEMVAPSFQLLQYFTDRPENISRIARSLRIPALGALWDGKVDRDALREAARHPVFPIEVETAIDAWHLRPWVDELRVNYCKGSIAWNGWLRAQTVLRIFASALAESIDSGMGSDGDHSLRRIVRVSKQSLVDLLAVGSGLTENESVQAVESLTFDHRRRDCDWWSMPLIPVGDAELLVVPCMITSANPTRTLEAAVKRANARVSVRSEQFNRHVLEPFVAAGANVIQGLTIDAFDGRQLEFDGIVYWQERIILLEAKCLRSLDGPHDDWRASMEIEYAIEQLQRRRDSISRDWDKLRLRLADWNLPERPTPVVCVAVTNVLRFTTLQRDGVIVTDALCLRRFFAPDPQVYLISSDGERRRIGRIRVGAIPTAAELPSYLTWPLQLRWIFMGFTKQFQWIQPATGEIPIRFMTAAFRGSPEAS
ncbi:hypothetical protein BH09PLA1_BH09PLA1_10330 [soil metagenome]